MVEILLIHAPGTTSTSTPWKTHHMIFCAMHDDILTRHRGMLVRLRKIDTKFDTASKSFSELIVVAPLNGG